MIGILIDAQTNQGDFPNRIFYKVGTLTVLERTMLNCLETDHAHKVVVTMPGKDASYIKGGAFKSRVVNSGIFKETGLNRKAAFHFWGKAEDRVGRLYRAAMTHNVDLAVVISGDCPFLPTWLINAAIFFYQREGFKGYLYNHSNDEDAFDKGLSIEIIPFWMLADANKHCENRSNISEYMLDNFNSERFLNKDKYYIPNNNLKFASRDQAQLFDSLLHELDVGADLGDLLEDLNAQKPDA